MSESFDAYHELLGIPPAEQPPNHYRLLGIAPFEQNRDVISNAAARQMRFVRTLGGGKYQEVAQRMLNELAKAKLCLLDPQRRAEYDARMRGAAAPPPGSRAAEKTVEKTVEKAVAAEPERSWVVGGVASCDVLVDAPIVSSRHCKIVRRNGAYHVEDLGSTNGVYVNGERIQSTRDLAPGDVVTLGRQLRLPWPPQAPAITDRPVRIGRGDDNDVVLNHETVSASHARVTLCADGVLLEDAGSSNGVFVAGSPDRVARRMLDSQAVVRIGIYSIPVSFLFGGRAG